MNETPLLRLVTLGNSNAGKSSLLIRWKEGSFQDTILTIGVDFSSKMVQNGGSQILVQFWDSAGLEKFRSMTRGYLRGALGGLLVFDITKKSSFDSCHEWLQMFKEEAAPNAPSVLVGNKLDLASKREVPREAAQQLADEFGIPYFETSAKSGENLDLPFEKLVDLASASLFSEEEDLEGMDSESFLLNGSQPKSRACCFRSRCY